MKFLSCLVSFLMMFNSILISLPTQAMASSVDLRLAEQTEELRTLRKEKASLERKYFDMTLNKTKLENNLLDYKDRFFESEASLSTKLSEAKAPLKEKIIKLSRESKESQSE